MPTYSDWMHFVYSYAAGHGISGISYLWLLCGAALNVVLDYRAVTSSGSAELIAVSSLFTYDGYMHYINPRATGAQLLVCSKIMILIYTVLMGEPIISSIACCVVICVRV